MDPVTPLLRKFSFVRALERKVQRLERRVAELGQSEGRLESEIRRLQSEAAAWTRFCPHGHFYSPLPSGADIAAGLARPAEGPPFAGIDLNLDGQLSLLGEIAESYSAMPFPDEPTAGWRFFLNNPSYGPYDASVLFGVVRHLAPGRVVEVGCGYSSAAFLDMNEHVLGGRLAITFIDPDLSQLRRLVSPQEAARLSLLEVPVQQAPIAPFSELQANDILFVDTSHVSKFGSDVNHLFFKVLPELRPGVWVHLHDVTWDLEYPRDWLVEGRAWNELYMLRAFLMYNRSFRVMFSSALMFEQHKAFVRERMPRCAGGGGGQIWLRREG